MAAPNMAKSIPELGPETYARWRATTVGAITERLEHELILDLLGDLRGRRVLDVGCGDGALAVALSARGAEVVGIDVSPSMIAAARQRAKRQGVDVAFQIASADALPSPADHFDAVVAVTILCFVADARPVFREMVRVLRPGGRLVIGELGKWSSWAARRRVLAWFGSSLWQGAWFRTARELRGLAAEAGLVTEALRGAIYYPRSGIAARLLASCDPVLGRLTTFGAAFLALAVVKPIGSDSAATEQGR